MASRKRQRRRSLSPTIPPPHPQTLPPDWNALVDELRVIHERALQIILRLRVDGEDGGRRDIDGGELASPPARPATELTDSQQEECPAGCGLVGCRSCGGRGMNPASISANHPAAAKRARLAMEVDSADEGASE